MKFRFKSLLQESGWIDNAVVSVDNAGLIKTIEENKPDTDCDEVVNGYALPGFQNAHSHAFQYAMAGIAENHSYNSNDDFWSWRNAMYKLALAINPDQLEAIATMLYAEMLRHGYTNVAEFHYLHHDTFGNPYMNLAETGERLIAAAERAGIGITLIPIFYQKGGFNTEPLEEQRRFISNNLEKYVKLFEASLKACNQYSSANIGCGVHSMRAVEPAVIPGTIAALPNNLPFHIHISEQIKEIEDCVSHLGARPIKWMLDNVELSDRCNFVHATHADEDETYGLADMSVNTVLCPSTEGNLGDGLFPLREYQSLNGKWSIGTDSHVSLNPFEELRLLDYGQRLTSHLRSTFISKDFASSGAYAINQSLIAGRKAMGNFETVYFKPGEPLNACIVSARHPLIRTASKKTLLDTIVYSSDETMQEGTIVNGEWKVKSGQHIFRDEIAKDFVKVMKKLGVR